MMSVFFAVSLQCVQTNLDLRSGIVNTKLISSVPSDLIPLKCNPQATGRPYTLLLFPP